MSSTSTTSTSTTTTETATPPRTSAAPATRDGRVVAITGPVVDVEFPPDALPDINYAVEMEIELEGETHAW